MSHPAGADAPSVPGHAVLRRIGAGSSGEVWLARSATGALRAAKIIRRDRFEDERAFRREFEAVRRFEALSREHPAFLDILQTGWTGDTAGYFYVMELGDGARAGWTACDYEPLTLARLLRERRRLTADACVELGLRLCEGLEALHAEGFIHRDIKPSNVVYAGGIPKLADIGTVIDTHEAQSYVGTEGFIAPEGPNSAQSDLYALGKLLYVAATGRDRRDFPDPGTEMESGDEAPMLRELNLVLLKACAAHPRLRYPSARHLRSDLEHLRSGRSIRWHRRRQSLGRLLLPSGAAVLALAAVTGWLRLSSPRRIDAAPRAAVDARGVEVRALTMRQHLARGQELMASGDEAGALLCFSEALRLLPPGAPEEALHRTRIRLLTERVPRLLRAWKAGQGIASLAFAPDGAHIASCDDLGNLATWERATGKRVLGPIPSGAGAVALRYSPDGRRLIATPSDLTSWTTLARHARTGRVFDAATGKPMGPVAMGDAALTYSPDGRAVALGTEDGTIEVRDVETGRALRVLHGHANPVVRIAFGPSTNVLASADASGRILAWDLSAGTTLGPGMDTGEWVAGLMFPPDGGRLATVLEDSTRHARLRFWCLDGRPSMPEPTPLPGRFAGLDGVLDGGRRILAWQQEGDPKVSAGWTLRDASSPGIVLKSVPSDGRCRGWAASPDGLWMAAADETGGARVWDLETGEAVSAMMGHAGGVRCLAFSPDGRQILTGGGDGGIKAWDLSCMGTHGRPVRVSGRWIHLWNTVRPYPASEAPDGRLVLVMSRDERQVPTCVNGASGCEEALPVPPNGPSCGVVLGHPSGGAWAIYDDSFGFPLPSRDVGLWRKDGGAWSVLRFPHAARVVAASFDATGRGLVTLDAARSVRVWDVSTGVLRSESVIHGTGESPLLSSDAKALLEIEDGRGVVVHDLGKPGTVPQRMAWPEPVECVALSSDASKLAVGLKQSGLRVIEVATGRDLPLPAGWVPHPVSVSWAPSGRRLLVQPTAGDAVVVDWAGNRVHAVQGTSDGFPKTRVRFGADERFFVVHAADDAVWLAEAGSGMAVSPRIRHAKPVRHAALGRDGRLVIVSDPNVVRVVRVDPDPAGVQELCARARWLSGREIGPSGSLAWVGATDMEALSQRRGAPEASDGEEARAAWARRGEERFQAPESLAQVAAARFHQVHGAPLERLGILDRPPATPARFLDLSRHYSHSFGILADQDLAELPAGRQRMEGVEFDARGLLRLEAVDHREASQRFGVSAPNSYPMAAALGIRVQAPCRRLHFLMGVDAPRERLGAEVARWRMRFGDGQTSEFPIVYGRHLLDWHADGLPGASPSVPRPAWVGRMPSPHLGRMTFLYRVTWENPRPAHEVADLDFLLASGSSRPFVLAITADEASSP